MKTMLDVAQSTDQRSLAELRQELDDLRVRCDDAEATLNAIRSGHVDALIIDDKIYHLESAEAESNRFRGEALAQINDLVIAVDNENHLIYLNPAAERHYGVTSSDVLGKIADDLIKVEWPKGLDADAVRSHVDEHGFWRGESVHVRPDSTSFDAEATVTTLRDPHGAVAGRLAIIRDISQRKRAEEELRRAHDELETRVDERTRELAEANVALQHEVETRRVMEQHRTELLQRIVTTQEDERRRIARDIHDQLGQRVTALRLQLLSLTDGLSNESTERQIEAIKETATRLDSEVGFLAYELRPASLDDIGLPESARTFVQNWAENYDVKAEFSVRGFGDKRLNPDAETHLYRIMQEALNNIAKHAKAKSVSVILTREGEHAVLIVEDDGCGFDIPEATGRPEGSKGLGLLGIKERAALVGGEAQIESSRGQGTASYVRVPA